MTEKTEKQKRFNNHTISRNARPKTKPPSKQEADEFTTKRSIEIHLEERRLAREMNELGFDSKR